MRKPEPWLRKFKAKEGKPVRKPCWYLEIDGKQFRLHEKKAEAWRLYHELISRGELSADSAVGRVLDDFLEWTKQNRSARTYECYRYFLQSFLGGIGNAIRLRDLKPRHVTAWLSRTSWSDTTKNIAVRSVKGAFAWAAREGIIDRSPIAAVRAPAASRRERIISRDEWQRILAAVPEPTDAIRTAAENAVQRLTELTQQRQQAVRTLLDWLRVEYEIEKPSKVLQSPIALDSDAFVAEVKKVRGRRNPLSAAGLKGLRDEHARTIAPVQQLTREADTLEHRLSDLVNEAYGLTPDEIELMWQTAPPRMPIGGPVHQTADQSAMASSTE